MHLFINLTSNAVIYASTVYTIVAIKNSISNAANVTIRYIAKTNAATEIGELSTFCNIAAIIIVAIGNAKKINNVSINYLLLCSII